MHIRVIAVGTKMPGWVQSGVAEYQKRLPKEWRFTWVELPLGPRTKAAANAKARATEAAKATEVEGQAILAAINPQEIVVALDVLGKSWSTEKLAVQMKDWQMEGQNICVLIGGPDGLSAACLQRANLRWSLSALTLPHPLVRIVLAEQLYRSWTVLSNHPYHK